MTELLLTVHVLSAVVWVGGSVLLLALGYYLNGRDAGTRVEYTRWTEWIGPRLFAPASILVIITGPLLVGEIGYEFNALWLHLAFLGWFISFAIGVGFYPREGKKREALIESEGIESAAVAGSIDRVLRVASIDTLIVVLVVIDMTTKPGL